MVPGPVLELTQIFDGSGSSSRTNSNFLAIRGPILRDLILRVQFSGAWSDPAISAHLEKDTTLQPTLL